MISGPCLVLNRSFLPVCITSIKRAICLVFKDYARIVDAQYQLFDFDSWSDLSVAMHEDQIQLTQKAIRVPRVILLNFYEKLPRRDVKLTRQNIFLRDKNTCQYCQRKFKRSELNIDHVIPMSRGGKTTWDNIVCSCLTCNNQKGGRIPHEAGLNLIYKPHKPPYSIFMNVSPKQNLFEAWHVYMNPIDFAYWNLELKEE